MVGLSALSFHKSSGEHWSIIYQCETKTMSASSHVQLCHPSYVITRSKCDRNRVNLSLCFPQSATGGQGASAEGPESREGGDHSRGGRTAGPKETAGPRRGKKPRARTSEGQEEVREIKTKKGKGLRSIRATREDYVPVCIENEGLRYHSGKWEQYVHQERGEGISLRQSRDRL